MTVLGASWWLRQRLLEDPGQLNCIARVGIGHAEGGGRLFSVRATAVATALLIAAIWSAVKVAAEPEEDGSAIWSGRALLLACRVNGWLVGLLRGGILYIAILKHLYFNTKLN